MRPITPLAQRFWKYVTRLSESECWPWAGATTHGGYGVIQSGGRGEKIIRAHRLSYALHNGDLSDSLDVLHTCDNPPCVNPAHLVAGSARDNVMDMIGKGRDIAGRKFRARGVDHHGAKLTPDAVRAIRAEYVPGVVGMGVLARRHGVSKRTILNVLKLRIWREV